MPSMLGIIKSVSSTSNLLSRSEASAAAPEVKPKASYPWDISASTSTFWSSTSSSTTTTFPIAFDIVYEPLLWSIAKPPSPVPEREPLLSEVSGHAFRGGRKDKVHRGSTSLTAVNADNSAVFLDNAPANCQTKTSTLSFRLGSKKRIPNCTEIRRRYSFTSVFKLNDDRLR